MTRFIWRFLILLIVLFVLLIGGLIASFSTEKGSQQLWSMAQKAIGDDINLGKLNGTLGSAFQVTDFSFHSVAQSIDISTIDIEWSPGRLLERQIYIKRIAVNKFDFLKRPTKEPSSDTPFNLDQLSLPVTIQIDQADLTELSVKTSPEAEPILAQQLGFGFTLDEEKLALLDAKLGSTPLDINMSAEINLLNSVTDGGLSWHARIPDYAESKGDMSVSGSLEDLKIDIISAAPYTLIANVAVADVLGQAKSRLSVKDINVALSAIQPSLPPIEIQGVIKAQATETGDVQFQSALALGSLPQIGNAKTALSGSFADNKLKIEQWRFIPDNQKTEINGHGQVVLSPTPEVEFELDWQQLIWPLNGSAVDTTIFASPTGSANVTGTLASMVVALKTDIAIPVSAKQIEGNIKLDLSSAQPRIDGTLLAPSLSYPDSLNPLIADAETRISIKGQLPVLQADIGLSIKNLETQPQLSAHAEIDLTDSGQPALNVTGDWRNLQWPLANVDANSIQVSSQQGEFTVAGTPQDLTARFTARVNSSGSVKGEANYSPENLSLNTQWQNIDYFTGAQHIQSEAGALQVAGTPESYKIDFNGKVALDDKAVELKTTGAGNRTSIALNRFTAKLLDGEVSGDAELQWGEPLSGRVTLLGRDINPGAWWSEWPGRINGTVVGVAKMVDGELNVDDFNADLQGELREYPVNLQAQANSQNRTINVEQLSLRSGETAVNANGTLSEELDFNWDLVSTDLQSLHPQLSGQIDATGFVKGLTDKPVIKANIDGDNIAYGQNQINALVANVLLDTTDSSDSDIDVRFTGRLADIDINNASLTTRGLTRQHQIALSTDTSMGSLTANLDSSISEALEWGFDLNQAVINTDEWGQWKLKSSAAGSFRQGDLSISPMCFNNGESALCLEAEMQDGNTLAKTEFSNLALSTFVPPSVSEFTVEGAISGRGDFRLAAGQDPVGSAEITSTAGNLSSVINESQDESQRLIVFEPGKLSIELTNGQANANLDLPLAGEDVIKATATLSGSSSDWLNRSLRGNIETRVTNISFIEKLVPSASKVKGSVEGTMAIQGSLAKPTFNGILGLQDGSVELAGPDILLEKVNVALQGDPQSGMTLTGSATSGGGELAVSGNVDISKDAPVVEIVLTGERVQLMNTAMAEVYISPNLKLRLNDKQIDVTGDVVIPTANIDIKTVPRSAIKASGDQVIITDDAEADNKPSSFNLSARVKTRLGDEVNFSGFGLTGRLSGAVTSVEQPGKPGQINGEIKVLDGRYQAYGQNLTIETGRLLFAGAGSTNPALDLRASRQPTKEVKVGVSARGNLQQPDFSLYSTPSMTDRNKLSYLILGRAPDQTSSGEKSQLGQLALALGLKRSSGVTSSIGDTLGIDQIGVEAEPGSEAEQESFVIGKYLTPKLYLRYGIGLFEPINTLRLQYSINEHWKVVTESSDNASSGDIEYSIDR